MEFKENNNDETLNEMKLLKKKRSKNKSSNMNKSNKKNKNNSFYEASLEIKSLSQKYSLNFMMEEEGDNIGNKEMILNKFNSKEDDSLLLIIKRNNIIFETPEFLFMKGKKDSDKFPEEEKFNPYYAQRFYFFSLYDKGIQMDKESWYSVTPEEISEYISSILPDSSNSTILDAFCGCGGNTISFSKKFRKVIANDLFIEKINMAKNNAKVYNCPENIIYYAEDFLKLNLNREKIDYVFLSPPWGGPEYKNDNVYSLKKWITPDIDKIIENSFKISKNIIIYLPRNTDLEELANIIYKYDKDMIESLNNTILFDVKYLKSASKIKAILVLYGPRFNSIKIKLVKQYLINSIFKKNSNKINKNKIQKKLNILKVIGYSEYIRNLVEYKNIKKDFSGNIFLENLEKFFLENIMDENEKIEYENLNKKNKEENDTSNISNIINEKMNESLDKGKIGGEDEFIDIRNVLTEDKFNKVKTVIFL